MIFSYYDVKLGRIRVDTTLEEGPFPSVPCMLQMQHP